MAEIELRPYQKKFIDDVRNKFKAGKKRVVGVAPCGAGKTIMTGWMIRESLNRGLRSIFFVHRKELLDQTAETFERLHIPHGIICSGYAPTYELPVQIASIQTLVNRMNKVEQPDFLICDECHHILAGSYQRIINHWDQALLLGVTATPVRLGTQECMADVFDSIVLSVSVPELIDEGNLTPVRCFTIKSEIETKLISVKDEMGDYSKKAISKIMGKPDTCNKIVSKFLKIAREKKTIAYCVDVAHSKLMAETFRRYGVSAIQVDGTTPKRERQEIIEGFRCGDYQVLCNAELFGEGFDVPNCHAVLLARPTKSRGLYIQQAMRPMRPDPQDPDKVAMVVDFVGNVDRHGNPDEDRNDEWKLKFNGKLEVIPDGRMVKNCDRCGKEVPISALICEHCGYIFRQCPYCGAAVPFKAVNCPNCGCEMPTEALDSEKIKEVETQSLCKPHLHPKNFKEKFENIVYLWKRNNYKIGWVYHKAVEFAETIEDFIIIGEFQHFRNVKQWAAYQVLNKVETFEELQRIEGIAGFKRGWAYAQARKYEIYVPRKRG